MRDFLNLILQFIEASSLTDDEYDSIDQTDLTVSVYNVALYEQLAAVLVGREAVSTTTDRLLFFFKAKNVEVEPIEKGRSNILIGEAL